MDDRGGGDPDGALERTLAYWTEWAATCTYRGPYEDLVRRSALVLKLLTFEPTGALVAAPTTSLPEAIGGVRNWDYRYTWLRDAAFVLYALQGIGYHDEARRFFDWLEALCVGCCTPLQIMYTVEGGTDLPERTLDHLEGYRGSRPVRIGNAAATQRQLDVYGEVLDAAHVCYERMRPIARPLWEALRHFADQAARFWREPDHGIWEVRGRPQHFLYSKLLCWVALDRAVRLAESAGLDGNAGWRRTRDEIRRAILDEGYDDRVGAFTQAFGSATLDASALVIPLVGFLSATDPRMRSTVARIEERLTSGGLVYRYLGEDGLPGGEATFALCSFWLVDNLALAGRVDEARALFERIAGYANDVGLLAEEIEPGAVSCAVTSPRGSRTSASFSPRSASPRPSVWGRNDTPSVPRSARATRRPYRRNALRLPANRRSQHAERDMHGQGIEGYGAWPLVVIMVVVASWFVYRFLAPKRWREWSRAGLVQAFIIALYAEMYGFPLTLYVLTGILGIDVPLAHESGHLWATLLGFGLVGGVVEMILGWTFVLVGIGLLVQGWRQVYRAAREERLATGGLYAVVRHPQYLGIFMALFGQLVHWPTLPTLALFPVIVWAYVRLARKEEATLTERFGDQYRAYQGRVPMFFPRWRQWRRLIQPLGVTPDRRP